MPAWGVSPEAMANAIASGSATRPTVRPAARSRASEDHEYCESARSDAGAHTGTCMEFSSGEPFYCTTTHASRRRGYAAWMQDRGGDMATGEMARVLLHGSSDES